MHTLCSERQSRMPMHPSAHEPGELTLRWTSSPRALKLLSSQTSLRHRHRRRGLRRRDHRVARSVVRSSASSATRNLRFTSIHGKTALTEITNADHAWRAPIMSASAGLQC